MKCPKCGAENSASSSFCVHCGAKLSKEQASAAAQPAQQTEVAASKFNLILKKLTLKEKIIGGGAILCLISFFLPWLVLSEELAESLDMSEELTGQDLGNGALLMPILMLAVLALLYLSVGAVDKVKIKYNSYSAVIGAFFAAMAISLYANANWFAEIMTESTKTKPEDFLSVDNGLWLLILGSLVIVAGSLLSQKEKLK